MAMLNNHMLETTTNNGWFYSCTNEGLLAPLAVMVTTEVGDDPKLQLGDVKYLVSHWLGPSQT